MTLLLIAIAACLVVCAMPPDALEHLRKAAPDAVRIEVTRVIQQLDAPEGGNRWVNIEVHANVLAVTRSKHGLRPGDAIVIRWTLHSPRNRAAGDFPPLVDVDGMYDASLDRANGEGFVPAANSMSFLRVSMPDRA